MRILTIINSAEAGGAQALLSNWRELSAKNHEHHILVLQSPGYFSTEFESVYKSQTYLKLNLNPMNLFLSVIQICFLIKKLRPHIVHSHLLQSDLVAIFLSFICKSIYVCTVHNSSLAAERHRKSKVLQYVIAKMSFRFSAIICPAKSTIDFVKHIGYQEHKIRYIPNGAISPKHFKKLLVPEYTFLSLSRWHPVKDHLTLLKAFEDHISRFPKSNLMLSGFGINNRNADLTQIIQTLKISENVIVAEGPTDRDALFARSGCLILSSKSESLAMVGIESLARNTTVIASKVGDFQDIVTSDAALFEVGNWVNLAKCMDWYVNLSSEEIINLNELGRARFESYFTSEIWVHSHLKLFYELLGKTLSE